MTLEVVVLKAHLEGLLELLQALNGVHGIQACHHWAVSLPLNPERANVLHKGRHVGHQLLLEAALQVPNQGNTSCVTDTSMDAEEIT